MRKIVIVRGLPGSGAYDLVSKKREYLKIAPVDIDELKIIEEDIFKHLNVVIFGGFILDKTFFKEAVEFIKKQDVELEIRDFTNVPLKLCIQKDQQNNSLFGKLRITKLYNKYLK